MNTLDRLNDSLADLRKDVPPGRDLWPDIAARLEPRGQADRDAIAAGHTAPPVPASAVAPGHDRRRRHRRRTAGYAAAAAVVLALVGAWPLLPLRDAIAPPASDPAAGVAGGTDAGAPLLVAADALAREYQGALREVHASASAAGRATPPAALDAALERSATEVRAALAREPDALYLFQRLQRIYSHRLALTLRQA